MLLDIRAPFGYSKPLKARPNLTLPLNDDSTVERQDMKRTIQTTLLLLAPLLLLGAIACTSGNSVSGPGDSEAPNNSGSMEPSAGDSGEAASGSSSDAEVVVGSPTIESDPGMTWAEVNGERIEFLANGSQHYECTVGPDRVTINYQTGEGNDFLLNAAMQGGGWLGNLTFAPGGEGNVQYSASIPNDAESFGLGNDALSYEGSVQKIKDFDMANAEIMSAQIAVNCAWPGGDPAAVINGEKYTFPASGSQSFECNIESEAVAFDKSGGNSQLQIDATKRTADAWLGSVAIYTENGNFTSTIPEDGEGLTIEGAKVHYEGTFNEPSGGEVTGTVDVTCP